VIVVLPKSFWSSTASWLIMKVIIPEVELREMGGEKGPQQACGRVRPGKRERQKGDALRCLQKCRRSPVRV